MSPFENVCRVIQKSKKEKFYIDPKTSHSTLATLSLDNDISVDN